MRPEPLGEGIEAFKKRLLLAVLRAVIQGRGGKLVACSPGLTALVIWAFERVEPGLLAHWLRRHYFRAAAVRDVQGRK